MIPGGAGAAAAAAILIVMLAVLMAVGLGGWWLWWHWCARQGRPRPPLSWTSRILAGVMLVYVLLCATLLAEIFISDALSERRELRWKARQYLTLSSPQPFGEIILPAGSLVNREEPRIPGTENSPISFDRVTAVRLPHPLSVAGVAWQAFRVDPAVVELAEPATFRVLEGEHAGQVQHCEAGWLVTFHTPSSSDDLPETVSDETAPVFQPSRWRFRSCFEGSPLVVVTLRDGHEVPVSSVPQPRSVP